MRIGGRPLLAWTVLAVLRAEQPIRCVVSTDAREIAEVAADFGAEVVMRPSHLATDIAPTEPSVVHALDVLEVGDDRTFLLLQATSPVRLPGTIDAALDSYRLGGWDSMVGVVACPPFLWRGPADDPRALYPVAKRTRRQELTATDLVYRETGSLYIGSVGRLRRSSNRISGSVGLFEMPPEEGIDIDTPLDAAVAEAHLRGCASAADA